MQADGQTGLDHGSLYQLNQIGVVGIFPGTGRYLQDQRRLQLLGGLGDALHNLHVVDIECTNGVPAIVGFFEHFRTGDQWHSIISQAQILCNMVA